MLPSLRKRLRPRLTVALCPTQIAIVETGYGRRSQSAEPLVLACESDGGAPDWQAPLATLRDWLAQNQRAKTDVEVVLSNRFVRYAILPWSDEVQNPAEMATLARIRFETLFGEPAAHWEIQTDCDTYGKAGIGCATDKTLIEALQELIKLHGMRLVSLQPYFVRAFNRWRGRMSGVEMLLAVVESGHCILASTKTVGWHSIRSFQLSGHAELPLLIEREIVLQGLDPQAALYLHSMMPIDTAQPGGDRDTTLLEFDIPVSTTRPPAVLAMALCGEI